MAFWRIEPAKSVQRGSRRLAHRIAKRVTAFMYERIAGSGNPRDNGWPLAGPKLGVFWKYRPGDWRIIAGVEDEVVFGSRLF